MSVFFDHRAGTNTNSVHTDIQWHPSFALLAVATKIDDADNEAQGAVSLFFDEVGTYLNMFQNDNSNSVSKIWSKTA